MARGKWRKWLSAILTASMVLGSASVPAFAADTEEEYGYYEAGTEAAAEDAAGAEASDTAEASDGAEAAYADEAYTEDAGAETGTEAASEEETGTEAVSADEAGAEEASAVETGTEEASEE